MKFQVSRLCFIFIQPYMEYICHVWVGAPSCHVDVWDELQKRVAKLLSPTLTASLKPFPHLRNDEILSLHIDIIFSRSSCELAELVSLPYYLPLWQQLELATI